MYNKTWISVSSISKIYCRRVKDLNLSPAYNKNLLMSWLDGKSNYHGMDVISSNAIITIKKKNNE